MSHALAKTSHTLTVITHTSGHGFRSRTPIPVVSNPARMNVCRAAWDEPWNLDDGVGVSRSRFHRPPSAGSPGGIEAAWTRGVLELFQRVYGVEFRHGSSFLVRADEVPSTEEEAAEILYDGRVLSSDEVVTVGRAFPDREASTTSGVNMEINGQGVANRHARIEGMRVHSYTNPSPFGPELLFSQSVETAFYVTDLGSDGGTFLNNLRISPFQMHEVRPGDVVAFGDAEYRLVQVLHHPVMRVPAVPLFRWPWEVARFP